MFGLQHGRKSVTAAEAMGGVVALAKKSTLGVAQLGSEQSREEFAVYTTLRILGVLLALYCFLFGLDLVGVSLAAFGGKRAGQLFAITDNPIAALMVGILATVMVQSSSTSTSIVVGLVGAEVLTVERAIPIIMGANVGTAVTNNLVSMTYLGNRFELERAFSAATAHDIFNILNVLILLPIEQISAALSGRGGLLFLMSKGLADAVLGTASNLEFSSPTQAMVRPLSSLLLTVDKDVVKAVSFGPPSEHLILHNCSSCGSYSCLSSATSEVWKKVTSFEALEVCGGANDCKQNSTCYLSAGNYFKSIEEAHLIRQGLLQGLGDLGGGILGLGIALVVMCGALYVMVRLLHGLVMRKATQVVQIGSNMNDFWALLLGMALAFVVQSSSVVTSALIPLVAIAVLPVGKMLPITLGANIGTTVTSVLAALTIMNADSIQIAFCHLLFNILGVLIWFPSPMRRLVLDAAFTLGFYASCWRLMPTLYTLCTFVALPGARATLQPLFLGVSF
ncbi:unnamed protein product [Effrenium voratum]|nr:unnamed protein product [Effrenium voratum]